MSLPLAACYRISTVANGGRVRLAIIEHITLMPSVVIHVQELNKVYGFTAKNITHGCFNDRRKFS